MGTRIERGEEKEEVMRKERKKRFGVKGKRGEKRGRKRKRGG